MRLAQIQTSITCRTDNMNFIRKNRGHFQSLNKKQKYLTLTAALQRVHAVGASVTGCLIEFLKRLLLLLQRWYPFGKPTSAWLHAVT